MRCDSIICDWHTTHAVSCTITWQLLNIRTYND